ncbi:MULTISPECIES: hypothetical protein [unclassified Streptomyces]|uniref:hypothetical protein n=1 Tax=unclassified Streptomyces TaxID=2593676 RepID=UPI000C6F3294|nr:hypothetical protein [Streptomyces sp. 3214.6]
MAKSTWDSVRAAVARLFRRGGEESAEQELQLVDSSRQQLLDSAASERGSVEQQLRSELEMQLAVFLRKHPDAVQELQDLIDQVKGADNGDGARTSVHHNTESMVVISNGDINASGGFHYRSPEQSR